MTKANQFLDVFSMNEIQEISNSLDKLPNTFNAGNYLNGFVPTDLIFPYIKNRVIKKLEQLLNEKINTTVGMLLKAEIPWNIHTDYLKGDQKPKGAFLIPLLTQNTHTVIFNEECLTNFPDFIEKNKKLENNAKSLYKTLCSHVTENELEYVSLLAAYKWYAGSVIFWDRKLLHCSDNFLKNGLTEKKALIIFTNDDENL